MIFEDDCIDIFDGLYAERTVYFPAVVMLIDAYKKGVLHFPSCKHFEDITTVRRFFPAEELPVVEICRVRPSPPLEIGFSIKNRRFSSEL